MMTQGADLLAKGRSLRELVEAEADASDAELTMTKPVIEAFVDSGLFHIGARGAWRLRGG